MFWWHFWPAQPATNYWSEGLLLLLNKCTALCGLVQQGNPSPPRSLIWAPVSLWGDSPGQRSPSTAPSSGHRGWEPAFSHLPASYSMLLEDRQQEGEVCVLVCGEGARRAGVGLGLSSEDGPGVESPSGYFSAWIYLSSLSSEDQPAMNPRALHNQQSPTGGLETRV